MALQDLLDFVVLPLDSVGHQESEGHSQDLLVHLQDSVDHWLDLQAHYLFHCGDYVDYEDCELGFGYDDSLDSGEMQESEATQQDYQQDLPSEHHLD